MKTTDVQAWKPEIDMYIDEENGLLATDVLDKIFTVKTTNRLQINDQGFTGYNLMQEVGELGDAVEDTAMETYGFSYQGKVYRKQATFSSDVLETAQSDEVETMSRAIPRMLKYSRNLNSYGVIRKAFNAGVVYGDSKPLASTAHPRKDGNGTQSNTFSDGVQRDLTYDNLKLLEDQLNAEVSNVGHVLTIGSEDRNKVLIVPKPLRELAFQIAGVNGPDGKPVTADNDKNYFRKGTKYDVFVCNFLGYEAAKEAGEVGVVTKSSASNYWDSMWAIADVEVMKKFFKVYIREGYEKYDDEVRKANQALIKYAYDKYAYGTSGWQGTAFSKGDNTTYAG